jgi:hypothetical protein
VLLVLVNNFCQLKKFLLVLFIAATVFTGCQKDTSTAVKISSSDLATINGQLKGTWVFPVETQNVVDVNDKPLTTAQYTAAPALQFDGSTKVKIFQNTSTTLNGTYTLSTSKGYVFINVIYPDGTSISYQVSFVNSQTLKLISSQPYVYYAGGNPQPASTVSNVVLQKQNSADVTGHIVRVSVNSDTVYSVSVYYANTKLHSPADTAVLVDSKANITGTYTFAFPSQSGYRLKVDIAGDYTKTTFYAYYNGIPLTGNTDYLFNEIKTGSSGWLTP